jgi:hypothetical protein
MLQCAERESDKAEFLELMDDAGLATAMGACETTTRVFLRNLDKFVALSGRFPVPTKKQLSAMQTIQARLEKQEKTHKVENSLRLILRLISVQFSV